MIQIRLDQRKWTWRRPTRSFSGTISLELRRGFELPGRVTRRSSQRIDARSKS